MLGRRMLLAHQKDNSTSVICMLLKGRNATARAQTQHAQLAANLIRRLHWFTAIAAALLLNNSPNQYITILNATPNMFSERKKTKSPDLTKLKIPSLHFLLGQLPRE